MGNRRCRRMGLRGRSAAPPNSTSSPWLAGASLVDARTAAAPIPAAAVRCVHVRRRFRTASTPRSMTASPSARPPARGPTTASRHERGRPPDRPLEPLRRRVLRARVFASPANRTHSSASGCRTTPRRVGQRFSATVGLEVEILRAIQPPGVYHRRQGQQPTGTPSVRGCREARLGKRR